MSTYSIGSKVVHPFYGAGVIVSVQEKRIGDTNHAYYVILTRSNAMQLMVPVHRAQSVGLRDVGEGDGLRQMLVSCSQVPGDGEIETDLRARQLAMRERLKSGSFEYVADVVRKLYFMNARRPLGTIDRQLFDQGKDLLASELALSLGYEMPDALQEIEDCLSAMFRVA